MAAGERVDEFIEERREPGREGLGLLIEVRVLDERRIERRVRDESARRADRELERPCRMSQRLRAVAEDEIALGRDLIHRMEGVHRR